MPAGTARSPGAFPGGFAGLGGFPEHEVGDGIALVFVGVHAGTQLHALPVEVRQAAVVRQAGNAVVDGALADVSQILVLQPLDEGDHLRNVLRGPGQIGEVLLVDLHGLEILEEGDRVFLRQVPHGAVARCIGGIGGEVILTVPDGFVIHVREVHAVTHLVARRQEGAFEQILEQERPQVADVGEVVDRGAACVEGDDTRRDGRHGFHLAGHGVEESEDWQRAHPSS